MNKYLVTVNVLCEKLTYIEAKDIEEAKQLVMQGQGTQIGSKPQLVKYLEVLSVKPTEMEI